MAFFDHLKVRWKLALLAGVPVIGALALSILIARDAQQRARKAAGLGSIEDLALLTTRMTFVIHNLQIERAELAYRAGIGESTSPEAAAQEQKTDGALQALEAFLSARDESKLPTKLATDLKIARERLAHLSERRSESHRQDMDLDGHLAFYSDANDSLIGATAAITQLTDDGEVLRSIFRLVGAMQVIERSSREHALLGYVFAKGEFPPGSFRYFVTLLTEQSTHTASIRTLESDEQFRQFQAALKGPSADALEAMRKIAIESQDTLEVPAKVWFDLGSSNMRELFRVEQDMADAVRVATTKKVGETRAAIRLGTGLAAMVIVISGLLAWAITRSLLRSVRVLSDAAETVHRKGDFSVRAEKTSYDELGLLTDAFNGMLSGIQERDGELRHHRENLEALVDARTRELSERNLKMRLVLDNVEQGLVMIDRDGGVLGEYSRRFAESFGAPRPGTPFHEAIAGDAAQESSLALNYEQLIADVLPVEVAVQQMPKALGRGGRQFALSFTPVIREGNVDGALLMTRDVTAEVAARAAEAEQRQKVKVFERLMRDPFGFLEFLAEVRAIVDRLAGDSFADRAEKMRAIHTLKGNAAIFDVSSLADAAHQLEQALLDDEGAETTLAKLLAVWQTFIAEIEPILGEDLGDRIEVTQHELQEVISLVRSHAAHHAILRSLVRLRHEPAHLRFKRIEEQLKALAGRLHKAETVVNLESGDVRFPVTQFKAFWTSFAHVVRNIVDHGLESEAERRQRGKPAQNHVELRVRSGPDDLILEIADDGRGIDWARLAEKAAEKNLPYGTREELVRAMFADGVSTAQEVTAQSGRGVGMSAVLAACASMHATISVESEPGRGTRFRFVFPSIEDVIAPAVRDGAA